MVQQARFTRSKLKKKKKKVTKMIALPFPISGGYIHRFYFIELPGTGASRLDFRTTHETEERQN